MGVVSTIDIKNKRNNRGVIMKNKALSFLSLIISFLLVFSILSPISVFAAEGVEFGNIDNNWIDAGASTVGSLSSDVIIKAMAEANSKLGSEATGSLVVKINGTYYNLIRESQGKIQINKTVWNEAKQSDVTKSVRNFVDALTNSGADADAVQQVMTNLQESDTDVSSVMLPMIFESTKGDMYQAYKITSPFLELLSIVLGVGAVILILLLLFSTVMDLAYIGLPVWREAQQSKNGNSNKNPFGVSYEALTTVKEVEKGLGGGDGGYRNAYLLYFRRRALTYIILAICIMYLICGGLSGIIGFVLSLVSGITG